MDSYFTLQSNIEASGEFVDRKSRFIAQLVHIESEDEANAFIEMVRKRHYDARHNVPAWILVDGRAVCRRSRCCAARGSKMFAAW